VIFNDSYIMSLATHAMTKGLNQGFQRNPSPPMSVFNVHLCGPCAVIHAECSPVFRIRFQNPVVFTFSESVVFKTLIYFCTTPAAVSAAAAHAEPAAATPPPRRPPPPRPSPPWSPPPRPPPPRKRAAVAATTHRVD